MALEKRARHLLTVKEVAGYLKVNQNTIYRLLRRSEIPAFKVGGDWRFSPDSIDAWRLSPETASIAPSSPTAEQFLLPAHNGSSQLATLRQSSSPPAPGSHEASVLERIYQEMRRMLEPIAEVSRILPALKRIAEAVEDRRDASGEIAQLYEKEKIAFRNHSENLARFAPNAFGVADGAGHLVSFNDAYQRMFGFRRQHLQSVAINDLIHHDDLARFATFGAKMWKGKARAARFVGRRLTANGNAILIRSTVWPIQSTRGGPPQYLAGMHERIASRHEATSLVIDCAEGLSKRREKLLADG